MKISVFLLMLFVFFLENFSKAQNQTFNDQQAISMLKKFYRNYIVVTRKDYVKEKPLGFYAQLPILKKYCTKKLVKECFNNRNNLDSLTGGNDPFTQSQGVSLQWLNRLNVYTYNDSSLGKHVFVVLLSTLSFYNTLETNKIYLAVENQKGTYLIDKIKLEK